MICKRKIFVCMCTRMTFFSFFSSLSAHRGPLLPSRNLISISIFVLWRNSWSFWFFSFCRMFAALYVGPFMFLGTFLSQTAVLIICRVLWPVTTFRSRMWLPVVNSCGTYMSVFELRVTVIFEFHNAVVTAGYPACYSIVNFLRACRFCRSRQHA